MPLTPEKIEEIDREEAHGFSHDRVSERIPIWGLFFSMSTIFAVVGLQSISSQGAYVIGLEPLFISCFAQHVYDSQVSQNGNYKFLMQQELDAGCTTGTQHFFASLSHKANGGNKRAMRKAFTVCSLVATALFLEHLYQDHVNALALLIAAAIELYLTAQTVYYLTYWKPHRVWWRKVFSFRGNERLQKDLKRMQADVIQTRQKLLELAKDGLLTEGQRADVERNLYTCRRVLNEMLTEHFQDGVDDGEE